jgi:Mn2+/Fe2+ NRAMP family transporter
MSLAAPRDSTEGDQGGQQGVAIRKPAPDESIQEPEEQQPVEQDAKPRGMLRTLGLGLITGAADDDPSAIGTYASAGAAIGPSFLWTAPVTFPMMCAVVYLAAKLGQVSGRGLFHVIKYH